MSRLFWKSKKWHNTLGRTFLKNQTYKKQPYIYLPFYLFSFSTVPSSFPLTPAAPVETLFCLIYLDFCYLIHNPSYTEWSRTYNIASTTEELNSSFHLTFINLHLKLILESVTRKLCSFCVITFPWFFMFLKVFLVLLFSHLKLLLPVFTDWPPLKCPVLDFLAPVLCWNLSAGLLDFHEGSLIHGWFS